MKRVALWLVTLAAAMRVLTAVALPLRLGEQEPVMSAFAVLRLMALGIAWYLVVVTVLGLVARATRIPALVRSTNALAVAPVRRLLHLSVTATVGLGTLSTPASASGPPASHDPPVIRSLPEEEPRGAAEPVMRAMSDSEPDVPTSRPDPDPPLMEMPAPAAGEPLPGQPAPEPVSPPAPDPPPQARQVKPPPASAPEPQAGTTWTVSRGDSFWAIAEALVPAPDVDRYWRALIEANRGRLADPDNPDLLFVGQELVLPTRAPP